MDNRSTLIRNARLVPVVTEAPTDRPVDLRIADGVVQEVAAAVRPHREDLVIDAAGRWAIPGLWDAHVHMAQWSQQRSRLDVSGTAGPQEVAHRVAQHLDQLPANGAELVIGTGYLSATWPQAPTVGLLDSVSGSHPVVLVSGDSHNGWLNSAALRLLDVPARDGVLDENEWFAAFGRLAELPAARQGLEADYRQAVQSAAARGLVGIVDMEFGSGYRDWPALFGRGIDALRVRAAAYPDRLDEVIAAGHRSGQALVDDVAQLTMGPLKIISDGSLNSRTACCHEPYADAADLEFPRGKQNYSLEELISLLTLAHRSGLEVAVHAIGDAAVSTALDAFAATGATGSIEHAQLMCTDDVLRMSRLGIRASVQPAHLLDDRPATAQCWPDRADRCFLLQSMTLAGVELALGSDAPVAPLDPWLSMAAAVHRAGDGEPLWNPGEALTAAQALAASTDGQPTITAGSRGDITLLDDDPLKPERDSAAVSRHLRRMRVAGTFVGGRPTHLEL
ncbi:MAG TPA: amidohydrolase family protein [Propionibacteriaceae bacterium]